MALAAGLDPNDLAQCGWGVICSPDTHPAVFAALAPLLELRKSQAGPLYREFTGVAGPRPQESVQSFLARHGASIMWSEPARVPYYLLIVGDPVGVPFGFQSVLGVTHAVGRLSFSVEGPEGYARYARSVVSAETGTRPGRYKAAFFAPVHTNDPATQNAGAYLIKPLADRFASHNTSWDVRLLCGEPATKSQLSRLLGGEEAPDLLFVSGHGLNSTSVDVWQSHLGGAILCQDWRGPGSGTEFIPNSLFSYTDDLPPDATHGGMVVVLAASFSVGSSLPLRVGQPQALAQLPQTLLARPQGGPLAVVGYVDRYWGPHPGVPEHNMYSEPYAHFCLSTAHSK